MNALSSASLVASVHFSSSLYAFNLSARSERASITLLPSFTSSWLALSISVSVIIVTLCFMHCTASFSESFLSISTLIGVVFFLMAWFSISAIIFEAVIQLASSPFKLFNIFSAVAV